MCNLGHFGFWKYESDLINAKHRRWRNQATEARLAKRALDADVESRSFHNSMQSGTALSGLLAFFQRFMWDI